MTLTDLELTVLGVVVRGEDPWKGKHGTQSRSVSQALQRLARKGAVVVTVLPGSCYAATDEGKAEYARKVSLPEA